MIDIKRTPDAEAIHPRARCFVMLGSLVREMKLPHLKVGIIHGIQLIGGLADHDDWAVIICLVGGGQEIHDGEAGISEWFNAINFHFPHWKVFCSNRMTSYEYVGDSSVDELLYNADVHKCSELHLSVSMRSFRSELVSAFAKAVIDVQVREAKDLYKQITKIDPITGKMKYPILLTRDLSTAKNWVRSVSLGTERYGIIASSGAKRLRADGI